MDCEALEELLSGGLFLCPLAKGHSQVNSPEAAAMHGAAGTLTQRRVGAEVPTKKGKNKPGVASAKHVTTQFEAA